MELFKTREYRRFSYRTMEQKEVQSDEDEMFHYFQTVYNAGKKLLNCWTTFKDHHSSSGISALVLNCADRWKDLEPTRPCWFFLDLQFSMKVYLKVILQVFCKSSNRQKNKHTLPEASDDEGRVGS